MRLNREFQHVCAAASGGGSNRTERHERCAVHADLRVVALICCGIAIAGSGGCATATVAAAGTAMGLAASAISTGGDIYRLGKLDAADEARYDRWIVACRAAAARLHYRVEKDLDKGKGHWICIMRDDRQTRVIVTVERRTETVCLTRVDVGLLGSEPTARLILASIRRQANPASTQPQPRSGAETDAAEKSNGESKD